MEKSCVKTRFYKKYRHLLIAIAGWIAFLIIFFLLKSVIPPRFFIHCRIDDYIPFVKWSIFAYCLWYFYLAAPLVYFGIVSKPDFIKLQSFLFIGMGICLLVYVFYPNAINFRPAVRGGDLISKFIALLFSVDSSTMVTPSMHVFAAVATHISLAKGARTGGNKLLIIVSFIVMISICLSTVLIKQHSVIDIFWGVILALALYFPVYKNRLWQKRAHSDDEN